MRVDGKYEKGGAEGPEPRPQRERAKRHAARGAEAISERKSAVVTVVRKPRSRSGLAPNGRAGRNGAQRSKMPRKTMGPSGGQFLRREVPEHPHQAVREGVEVHVEFALCAWSLVVFEGCRPGHVGLGRNTYGRRRSSCTFPPSCCRAPSAPLAAGRLRRASAGFRPACPCRSAGSRGRVSGDGHSLRP